MTTYTDLKAEKPLEGGEILVGASARPMRPRAAVYEGGKFYDTVDGIEIFPTHWKYKDR